eukprot:sb/3470471/
MRVSLNNIQSQFSLHPAFCGRLSLLNASSTVQYVKGFHGIEDAFDGDDSTYAVITNGAGTDRNKTSKQPIRTRFLGHVTGNQPIRDQYFLIRSTGAKRTTFDLIGLYVRIERSRARRRSHLGIHVAKGGWGGVTILQSSQYVKGFHGIEDAFDGDASTYAVIANEAGTDRNKTSKQPIRTRFLGHVTGNQPIRDQYFLIRSVPD